MPEYEVREPSYEGTTTADWSAPQLSDFDTDELSAVADHFLLSSSGFPPENFGDLHLPVVDPDGNLNADAIRTAYGGGHGVEQVQGIDDETVEEVRSILEGLADEFDEDVDPSEPPQ